MVLSPTPQQAPSEEARLRALLGDLLAVIHRDGGHYVEAHGWERACADAEARVLAERAAQDP
jgi:hypothetical protein